ncbi:hypothetical protein ZWY2020_038084 [Hordeum vulgare]|nr:hypothetical protein ZWY2020_038084 [Hordeum vulgare]
MSASSDDVTRLGASLLAPPAVYGDADVRVQQPQPAALLLASLGLDSGGMPLHRAPHPSVSTKLTQMTQLASRKHPDTKVSRTEHGGEWIISKPKPETKGSASQQGNRRPVNTQAEVGQKPASTSSDKAGKGGMSMKPAVSGSGNNSNASRQTHKTDDGSTGGGKQKGPTGKALSNR